MFGIDTSYILNHTQKKEKTLTRKEIKVDKTIHGWFGKNNLHYKDEKHAVNKPLSPRTIIWK